MKIKTVLSLVLVTVFLLGACSPGTGGTTTTVQNQVQTESQTENTQTARDDLNIAYPYLPLSLDPQGYDDVMTESILENIYQTLVDTDEAGTIIPGVAESWDISADGLEYIFHITKNGHFENGDPVTAEDVKFTLERCTTSPVVQSYFSYIDTVEIVDEATIKVTLKHASEPFLRLAAAYSGITSKKYVEGTATPFVTETMGCGAYKMVEYLQDDKFIVTRNDGYNGKPAAIKDVVFKKITNASTAAIALEAGELDMLVNPDPDDLERLRNDPRLAVAEGSGFMNSLMGFNCTAAPFDNVLVRQAVAYALDKEEINIGAANGLATIADSHMPEGVPGYLPEVKTWTRDVEKAKQLLTEAGYPDGFSTKVLLPVNKQAFAEVLQAQLREVGIDAQLEILESAAYYDAKGKGQFDIFLGGWGYICQDADVYIYDMCKTDRVTAGNYGSYSNARVDELVAEARVSNDQKRRAECYEEVNLIISEEYPTIPFVWNHFSLVYDKDIKNVVPHRNEMWCIYRYSW